MVKSPYQKELRNKRKYFIVTLFHVNVYSRGNLVIKKLWVLKFEWQSQILKRHENSVVVYTSPSNENKGGGLIEPKTSQSPYTSSPFRRGG